MTLDTISSAKEAQITAAPILLFDCTFFDGSQTHWCTQALIVDGTSYDPRVCRNNLFELQTGSDQGVDTIPKITLELADSDSVISELDRTKGFKGARLKCSFVFYDQATAAARTKPIVLFQGVFDSPDWITEDKLRVTAINRLSAQRVVLPALRVQRRCAWNFPGNAKERLEAVSGGLKGDFSRFFHCGYSADQVGGVGNLNGSDCYTGCSYTRQDCETRGMFKADSRGNATARFSGIEFVPSAITVRSAGERGSHVSPLALNDARYNDFIPMVYGSAWYTPSIVFARNDGNLTRLEVLLGVGEMQDVHKVLVSGIEIPLGRSGTNMTGTGWFNVVTFGGRTGNFNLDFANESGVPLGDPYGGLAMLSVVVPNRINDGKSLPEIAVLADGLKLTTYNPQGIRLSRAFTNNPAWVILDILLRNGWNTEEVDLVSFSETAAYCGELIDAQDAHGNPVKIPRFQCNLVLKSRRSAGDVLRGVRSGSRLFLSFGVAGLLQLKCENTTKIQQPTLPGFSNAKEQLDGGWPAYEFGDGTLGSSGILRNADGTSSFRITKRGASDTPNRFAVEFQDSFNEYQQDSFSLSHPADIGKAGQEINSAPTVLGLPNYNQAARILQFFLSKSVEGNLQVEFQTSVRALGIVPGDIITVTYLRAGLQRQPFRVLRLAPGQNFRSATITAQLHDDVWYSDVLLSQFGTGRRLPTATLGLPRPLSGVVPDPSGFLQFVVTESPTLAQDGTAGVTVSVQVAAAPTIAAQAPAIPIVGLTPEITATNAGLSSSQTLYYAVSGVDSDGSEGFLSFIIRARLPENAAGFTVKLTQLSFSRDTVSFHVYRGLSPIQLNRIASNVLAASSFLDSGLATIPILPPDINFHHSNLYWRLESQGEVTGTIHSPITIGNELLRMRPNSYSGFAARVLRGKGAGQERIIASNTATVLTLTTEWDLEPDTTSIFVVSQAGFRFGATGRGDQFQFDVPNQEGTVIQILGLSANAANAECPSELSPLTRWKIGGAGLRIADLDVCATPLFGLSLAPGLNGTAELSGISFPDLTNTASVVAGTLTLYWQDELTVEPPLILAAGVEQNATTFTVSPNGVTKSSFIRVESEVIAVEDVQSAGLILTVSRGMNGTTGVAYSAGQTLVSLRKTTITVPFARNFFGTPASGDWTYSIALENARIAAADFFVTNSQGNSPTSRQAYTNTLDRGLRTLSGGQYALQVAGPLAIQNSAAPDVILEADHVVGNITAFVESAPASTEIRMQVTVNGIAACFLAIDAGSTASSSLRGADLPVMRRGDRLGLDVLAVGSTLPGSDLTVVIRI